MMAPSSFCYEIRGNPGENELQYFLLFFLCIFFIPWRSIHILSFFVGFFCKFFRFLLSAVIVLQIRGFMLWLVNLEIIANPAAD